MRYSPIALLRADDARAIGRPPPKRFRGNPIRNISQSQSPQPGQDGCCTHACRLISVLDFPFDSFQQRNVELETSLPTMATKPLRSQSCRPTVSATSTFESDTSVTW